LRTALGDLARVGRRAESCAMRTLLVIEDSPSQRAAILEPLAEAKLFDGIDEAPDGAEGLRLLMSREYTMVLCDVELPTLDGSKLLIGARQQPSGGPTFLMLTAVRDPKRRAALLRAGARDVIAKPVDALELVARVELHLEVARLQSELAAKNASLAEMARTDALTGLPNRRRLEEALAHEWSRAQRYGHPLAVAIADIDHFKRVNDAYGHAAGDVVLKAVGACLRKSVRASDIVGRWGGEEFVAVLCANEDGATRAAEKWRKTVGALVVEANDARITPKLSIGVAARNASTASPAALLAAADEALYEAKRGGRDRVVVAPF
jgi:diguanylate cyclase (GGDEF)-like protein